MSYRALYRVWRPQRFDELIGQDVITQTLKNAIITGQISHAYLFAGPRGTGKTSAAKIFAKAVNCPNVKDGEPCNHCRICKSITEGKLNDVIEIDAASNNGVDEIRDVRNKAKYAPTEAKYKVYIIDEVHMLSTGAFNALLKTLEEPPAHVIFIMATTEPQKIPATIISRTQRFNFKRIRSNDILKRMKYILKHDRIKYEPRALKIIARAAEGGMRDALSILDEVLSYGKDHVTYRNALQVTGSVTHELLYRYLDEIIHHNIKSALADVQKVLADGKDANQFIEELLGYCQAILLYQQSPQMVIQAELGIVDQKFKQLATSVDPNLIYSIISQTNSVEEQMRLTVHPDVYLEVLTVRIATVETTGKVQNSSSSGGESNDQVMKRLSALTKQVNELQNEVRKLKSTRIQRSKRSKPNRRQEHSSWTPRSHTPSDGSTKINFAKVEPILSHASRGALVKMKKAWHEIIPSLPVTERAIMNVSKPVAASEKGVIVAFAYQFFYRRASSNHQLIQTLSSNLDQIVGNLPTVVLIPGSAWSRIRASYYRKHHLTPPRSTQSSGSDSTSQNHQDLSGNVVKDPNATRDARAKKKADRIFGQSINQLIKIKND